MADLTAYDRVQEVRARIARAAARAGRDPDEIRLVAVSKTFGPAAIRDVADAGVQDFGENRAQELRAKMRDVDAAIRWHFVGRLQRNKVRLLVGGVAMIHSIDSLELARAASTRSTALDLEQDVLIEVNVSQDPAKGGVGPSDAISLARAADDLEGLRVRGVMTMPPHPERPEDSRPAYRELARLRDELTAHLPDAVELSMGMTRDFEVAIEEGATIVRIGEAIFGPRDPR